jgi:hypothetical protein
MTPQILEFSLEWRRRKGREIAHDAEKAAACRAFPNWNIGLPVAVGKSWRCA